MWHARLKTKPKKKIFKWSSGQGLEIMTSAGSAADRKHVDFASRNGSRPSEQLFVQEEGDKKRLVCTDKGVSFDLQRKTCRQVLGSAPQLETLKGVSCIGMRCRGHVENAPSLKEGWNKKKNTRREKTHQQTHINQKSVSPQLQKLTDGCSCDRPGRKRQAERGRSVGKRKWKWNQGIRIILKVNS